MSHDANSKSSGKKISYSILRDALQNLDIKDDSPVLIPSYGSIAVEPGAMEVKSTPSIHVAKMMMRSNGAKHITTMVVHKNSKNHKGGRVSKKINGLTNAEAFSTAGDGKTFNPQSQSIPHMKFRFPDNVPFRYVQTATIPAWISSTVTVVTGIAKIWTTADILQFSSFAAVFDQYKITKIEAWLLPRNPGGTGAGASNVNAINRGLLYTAIDYDAGTVPTTSAQIEQYENCVVNEPIQGVYRSFRPHIAQGAWNGSSLTNAVNTVAPWLDCSNTNTQHFSLIALMSASDSVADGATYDMVHRMHIEFKNLL